MRRSAGFSLIELLVALAIMAALVSVVGPRLFSKVDQSKVQAAKSQVRVLKTSMSALRLDLGRFPTQEEGLAILMEAPTNQRDAEKWFGPYLDNELPTDPWGADYIYVAPKVAENGAEGSPRILSYGADNAPGGSGPNADISL